MILEGRELKKQTEVDDYERTAVANPAVKELLDHLAQELADEYILLIRQAYESDKFSDPPVAKTNLERD